MVRSAATDLGFTRDRHGTCASRASPTCVPRVSNHGRSTRWRRLRPRPILRDARPSASLLRMTSQLFHPRAMCSNGSSRTGAGRPAMSAIRSIARTLLLAAVAAPAAAQEFPTRPVALVVPYAAGGNVDISARALQGGLGNSLGAPFIVENRPGAGGTLAGQYVARSVPDGYTLFVGSNGP